MALREAIARDAASFSTELHGPNERRHMAELNAEGQMDTAEPLLRAVSQHELWNDVQKALVAHVGTGGKPWLGHSDFHDDIGMRALRFYYMHRGFENAFQGIDPELDR
jgi:hypothetical protein